MKTAKQAAARKMLGLARAKGQQLPTFENAPDEMLPENLIAFEMRMKALDEAHARARSPERRRFLEARMKKLHAELEALRKTEKNLNEAAERWWYGIEQLMKG